MLGQELEKGLSISAVLLEVTQVWTYPARSAKKLVLDFSYGALLNPVHLGGGSHVLMRETG